MNPEAIFEYVLVDGYVESTKNPEIFENLTGTAIYEVLRVVNGKPMFLEDHLERVYNSANLTNYNMQFNRDEIVTHIKRLISENGIKNNNIKLLLTFDKHGKEVFLVYGIESFYPPISYYEEGIRTVLYNYQREKPNAKVQHIGFKEKVNGFINKEKAFEALLINDEGYILEGSRSNIFFIMEGQLFTTPATEVLLGITRKHIISLGSKIGYPVIERSLHKRELNSVEGLFISGTSVGILPISSVEELQLPKKDHRIIAELLEGYQNLVNDMCLSNS